MGAAYSRLGRTKVLYATSLELHNKCPLYFERAIGSKANVFKCVD